MGVILVSQIARTESCFAFEESAEQEKSWEFGGTKVNNELFALVC
jgi:hypothetical protein